MPLDVKTVTPDDIFRIFTACRDDPKTIVLDVRPYKAFAKKHVIQAFNIRLSSDGRVLLDYSKNSYNISWSTDCWWDKPVLVYGGEGLKKDHPVVQFLARDGHARSLSIYKDGVEGIEKTYPYILTASIKANSVKTFPSQIVPGLLYLGDWPGQSTFERLQELSVRRIITIHNNPESMQAPSHCKVLRFKVADVETEDISGCLAPAYDFIEEAAVQGHGVLVHCGAGVSRSATLVIAYIMRKHRMSAAKALKLVVERRSMVSPNNGFWRTLCALEGELGIADRSDPTANAGGAGADADANAPTQLVENAAGEKVAVEFVELVKVPAAGANGAATASGTERSKEGRGSDKGGRGRVEEDSRSRSRDREDRLRQRRSRSSSRSRERGRMGGRGRSWSRDRGRDRGRGSRSRSRSRGGRRRGGRDTGSRREDAQDGGRGRAQREERRQEEDLVPAKPEPAIILEVVRDGRLVGHYHLGRVGPTQAVTFGRLPSCDVMLEHLSISRQHAQLRVDRSGAMTITDLGSAHGTNVDEVWVRANVPRQLSMGSTFKFGGSTRVFKVTKLQQQQQAAKPA